MVDVVIVLYVCDMVIDDVICFVFVKCVQYIVLVLCCQVEVVGVLCKNKGKLFVNVLIEVWCYLLYMCEFGSQIINVLCCLQFEVYGYQVSVIELVGWEYLMKNELIIVQYKNLLCWCFGEWLNEIFGMFGFVEFNECFFVV